jgi:hypothetical protein
MVLMRKLERLTMDIQRRSAAQTEERSRAYPWSLDAIASGSRQHPGSGTTAHEGAIRHQRSLGSGILSEDQPLSTLSRHSTGRRPGSSRRGEMPPPSMPLPTGFSPALQSRSVQSSPVTRHGSSMPTPELQQGATARPDRSSATRSSQGHGEMSRSQQHVGGHGQGVSSTVTSGSSRRTPTTDLSRTSTTKSTRSANSTPRSREVSNPSGLPSVLAHSINTGPSNPTESPPLPPRERPTKVRAVLEGAGRTLEFEVYAETNSRDLISRAYSNGDIGDVGREVSWVLYEVFGEIGCGESSL